MDKNKYVGAFEKLRHINSATLAGMLIGQLKKLDKAKELLRKYEWVFDEVHSVDRCSCCGNIQEDGHKEDCELYELIKEKV